MDSERKVCALTTEEKKLAKTDFKLMKAFREANRLGKSTPLLKLELNRLIQTRRHSEGKGELTVEFKEPEATPESEVTLIHFSYRFLVIRSNLIDNI